MVAKSKPGTGKVQCPYCKEWVTAGATRCPHCQSDFTASDQQAMKAANKTNLIGCGILAVVIILGASFCSVALVEDIPDEPQASAKDDALVFYRSVFDAGIGCDRAFTVVATSLGGDDPITAYRAIDDAESTCLSVGPKIRVIEVPSSVGKALHGKLTEARDRCDNAYVSKWAMLDDMGEVLNGDADVAKLASMQGNIESTQSQGMMCAAALVGPLTELGVKPEDMTQE